MAKLCELAEGYRVAAVQLKLARAALRVRMETMAGRSASGRRGS